MTTEALTKPAADNGKSLATIGGYSREQIDLLKRTIAKGTTDDEFALFMNTANRMKLDPFAKQIYAVKRWDSRANREVMSIQVSIDGFRSTASRTGELDGHDGPFWCGKDGVWKDVWLDREPPSAAKVVVYRKGCARPFTGIATFDSYAQQNKEGRLIGQWPQMPDVMIAKCAEALGLRKAFPSELGGVYTPEEMGQADNPPAQRGNAIDAAATETKPVLTEDPAAEALALELKAELDDATTPEEVRALAKKFNALPKGTRARATAFEAMQKRMNDVTPPEVA